MRRLDGAPGVDFGEFDVFGGFCAGFGCVAIVGLSGIFTTDCFLAFVSFLGGDNLRARFLALMPMVSFVRERELSRENFGGHGDVSNCEKR